MIEDKTRQIALDIIARTFCHGSAGEIGNALAEAIVKRLEAGGFDFAPLAAKEPELVETAEPLASEADAPDVDPPHVMHKARRHR